ncbi:universal stress protein [Paractinoplanes ferrugineus]|uniref:universal stress protein n=1 Tax=Paractinoplanes ferrugineus TaxID=113564 RepID=UPI001EF394FE|nr:universal stress protein [Actinoplanes ferrugineus]
MDGTNSSMRAGAYALGLARRQRCELVAVYVRALPSALIPLADTSGSATTTIMATHDDVERELRLLVAQQVRSDVDVRLVVRHGEPYTELVDVAKQVRADAVIVGQSCRTLHRIAGSLSTKLVRSGRWPVTVVP